MKDWGWFWSLLCQTPWANCSAEYEVCSCILGASWIWWNFWCIEIYNFWLKYFLDLVLFFSLLGLLHLFACRFYGRNSSYVHGGLDASGKPQEAVYGQAVSIKISLVIFINVWNKSRFFLYQWLRLSYLVSNGLWYCFRSDTNRNLVSWGFLFAYFCFHWQLCLILQLCIWAQKIPSGWGTKSRRPDRFVL